MLREIWHCIQHCIFGDNQKADIAEPLKYGIKTYQTPSAWDLLGVSSMYELASRICGDYDFAIAGYLLKELLQNPYTLQASEKLPAGDSGGMIKIKNNDEMGYLVFGPVILPFCSGFCMKAAKIRWKN